MASKPAVKTTNLNDLFDASDGFFADAAWNSRDASQPAFAPDAFAGTVLMFGNASVAQSPGPSAATTQAKSAAASFVFADDAFSSAGSNLIFHNHYDATVDAKYHAAVMQAEANLAYYFTVTGTRPVFNQLDSSKVIINESFSEKSGGFSWAGTNTATLTTVTYAGNPINYARVKAGLTADATSSDDKYSLTELPTSDPTNGKGFALTTAEAKVLGMWRADNTAVDDKVYLNTDFSRNNLYFYPGDKGTYGFDAVSILMHEMSEGMGRISSLGLEQSGYWQPLDLFRWSVSNGKTIHDYSGGRDGLPAYFGVKSLTNQFDSFGNGDLADWNGTVAYKGGYDAFGDSAQNQRGYLTPADQQEMDVLGWTVFHPVSSPQSASAPSSATLGMASSSNLSLMTSYMASTFAAPSAQAAATPIVADNSSPQHVLAPSHA